MSNTLDRKLLENAESSINDVKALLENVLAEPKVLMGFIADNIQEMIERGESLEAVQAYMKYRASDEYKEGIRNFTYHSVFGYFEVFDAFFCGIGWVPPDTYIPRERPWYIAAVEANGQISMSSVYYDADFDVPVIGYSRSLIDSYGNSLGVVTIDVPISFISEFLFGTITENSYGVIVDEQSIVVAHPSDDFIGEFLIENSPGMLQLMLEINEEQNQRISQTTFTNYIGIESILFSSMTSNGWYVNFVVPVAEYYKELYDMMLFISILGFVMALILSALLISLERARVKSDIKSRQKSNFLAIMSHEIRTPMNSIIGFSELALDNEDASPKTKHYLSSIADNAKWLLNIINDILDSSKIESGKIALEHIPYDLNNVISQCQSALLPKAVEKGIELRCTVEPVEGKLLVGDPVRMRQVIMNLLSNAIKFTDSGSVILIVSVKKQNAGHATLYFEFKDTGIGMDSTQLDRIFEPFMQADDSVTRKFGGTGLGLAITKNILEIMGSFLIVESTPGEGSTFSFEMTFDLLDADKNDQHTRVSYGKVDRPNFTGNVLVCEDNALNQQVICEHLNRIGLNTVVAYNGVEGVNLVTRHMQQGTDKAKHKPFDLIFMDIHMPVMDGLEAATKILEMGVETPIVALTANVMSVDLELYKASGIHDYLGKPFTTQDLWKCLLKYFSVISYTAVAEQAHNEEEEKSLNRLRIHFARSNQDVLDRVDKAINDNDIKLAHRLIHTLKSNAGQIGEKKLQSTSKAVEESLAENNIPLAKSQLGILKIELIEVLNNLAPHLIEEEEKNKNKTKITDNDKVHSILTELESMLIDRNPECMKMLDELYSIQGAENLALYVDDLEYVKAIEELNRLKAEL